MGTIQIEKTIQMHLEEDEKLMKLTLLILSPAWNILIAMQTYALGLIVITALAYDALTFTVYVVIVTLDVFFIIDLIATLVYVTNERIRRFKPYKVRNWKFLVVDLISVMPAALMYNSYVSEQNKSGLVIRILLQNRCLRMYRIILFFNNYDLAIRNGPGNLILMFVKFVAYCTFIAHVITCVWINLPHSMPCEGDTIYCILWHETYSQLLILHEFQGPEKMLTTFHERILCIVAVICGIIFIYGDFIPQMLLTFMRLNRSVGEYYKNQMQLERYLLNINVNSELNEQIQKYFKFFWQFGTTDLETRELLDDLPTGLKKEIFTDIYWDALRHSDVFRSVSRCCKRSLTLYMSTIYYQEGEIVFTKGKYKNLLIYLVHGIMELMAEENEDSPILSFSSGTVLGEMSIFLLVKSQGIIKCRTICEVHVLRMKDAFRVLQNYPKDKNIVVQKFNKRLVLAKITQWRKKQIQLDKMIGLDVEKVEDGQEDCVKWVKMQWRGIWEVHERHLLVVKAMKGGLRIPAWRKQYDIQIRLDMVSNFMDLMVLSDVFEEKKDVVCLKTTFPWSIDPKAEFFKFWHIFIKILAFIVSIVYPYCTAWLESFPVSVFTASCIITIMFMVDLCLSLMTAVKTRHGIITKCSENLIHQLQKPTFYLDVLAALPYQIYLAYTYYDYLEKRIAGVFLLPCCLKAHVFLKPITTVSDSMIIIRSMKNLILYILLLFWYAACFQLFLVNCKPQCYFFKWYPGKDIYASDYIQQYWVSIFFSLSSGLCIPERVIYSDDNSFFIIMIITNFFFFMWATFIINDFYIVYSITMSNRMRFKMLYTRVAKYLESLNMQSQIQQRILRLVHFQWMYNNADDLLTKFPIINMAPIGLRHAVYEDTVFRTLKLNPIFELESSEFIYDLIEKSTIIAVPAGTILVGYGLTCFRLYLLHKGYCQGNSFMENDVSGGLCSPILLRPGDLFPTLAAFSTSPVPISVISLTDCEIVVMELEELLKTMIIHDMFYDLFSVIHNNNYVEKLSHHTLAMIRVNAQFNAPSDKTAEYNAPFKKMGVFGVVLKYLSIKKNIYIDENFRQKSFLRLITLAYVIYLLNNALLWPAMFGVFLYSYKILFIYLTVIQIFAFIYMYIQCTIPFFDKRGLLITHPLYTFSQYMSHRFIFDFVLHIPIFTLYKLAYGSFVEQDNAGVVLCVIFQKTLGIIMVNHYISEVTRDSDKRTFILLFNLFLTFFVIMNSITNYVMFCGAVWTFSESFVVESFSARYDGFYFCTDVDSVNPYEYYIIITHWIVAHFTANDLDCTVTDWKDMIYANFINFAGAFLILTFYGWLAAHSAAGDYFSTLYQERMKSFLEFLLTSKAEDKIVENSVEYFEHQWAKTRGQTLLEICDHVPTYLLEELAYPLYRPTINRVHPFANYSDEGFYRILSTYLELVHFNRGSVIFVKGQLLEDIYIIHRGKCFVFDWFTTLDVGSIIGDIKRTGVMQNKVYALTHVELLRIDSKVFWTLLNNFYQIEKNYWNFAEKAENFIKTYHVSRTIQLRPVDSRDILNAFNLQSKTLGFEDQSFFEDPDNIATQTIFESKQKARRKRLWCIIYPGTWPMVVYKIMHSTVAFLTVIILPCLLFYFSLTPFSMIIIGLLDCFWLALVLTTFRIGMEDKIKGDIVTNYRYIVRKYILQWDGFFLGLLACLPFEIIYLLMIDNWESADLSTVRWLRSLRFIRAYYLIKNLNNEINKLKVSSIVRYLAVVVYFVIYVHGLVLFYLLITEEPLVVDSMDPFQFTWEQVDSLIVVYLNSVNILASANLAVTPRRTTLEKLYTNLVCLLSICVKGLIIKHILSIKYIYGVARGKYKTETAILESYLKRQEVSPSIVKDVLDYKLNILIATRSESMPTFLQSAPATLKLGIMTDLYLIRLTSSPIFRVADITFLKLLTCKLKRILYFPGQKVVEKGDVDGTTYFIHKGEVYVIDQTDDEAYIEYVVDRMYAGDEFGVAQGILIAYPHKFTIRARTVVEMLTLYSEDWNDLKAAYPDDMERILRTVRDVESIP